MKKKKLAVIFSLVFVLTCGGLVSCGSSDEKETNEKKETVVSETDVDETAEKSEDDTEAVKDESTGESEEKAAGSGGSTASEKTESSKKSDSSTSTTKSKTGSSSSDKSTATSSNKTSSTSNTGSSSGSSSASNKNNSGSSTSASTNSSNTSSGGSSSSSSSSGSTSSLSGSSGSSSSSSVQTHTHNWVAQTTTVHHDATGHNEQYVVKAAWDETVQEAVYEISTKWICNGCGLDVTEDVKDGTNNHAKSVALAGGNKKCGGWHSEYEQTLTGYNTYTIHHEAEYGTRWVEDTAAWDETVTTGNKCSGCGATK